MRHLMILAATAAVSAAAPAGYNYDEAKVPPYTLPDPLVCADGTKVTSAADWTGKRRPELHALIEREMFGKAPPRPALSFTVQEDWTPALGGKVKRRQVGVSLV